MNWGRGDVGDVGTTSWGRGEVGDVGTGSNFETSD
jgi:hypothetical protein